jgi:hypothetical protein
MLVFLENWACRLSCIRKGLKGEKWHFIGWELKPAHYIKAGSSEPQPFLEETKKMSNETSTQTNTMPTTIILGTHSTDPEFNGDCDYAVVQLTPELLEQIHRRVEVARQARQQDDDFFELYFWGGTAKFYSGDLIETCQEAVAAASGTDGDQAAQDWLTKLEQNGHALIPPTIDLAACQPQRTELDQMIVRRSSLSDDTLYEVAWIATLKHSDVCVTTSDLPLAALEGYVRNE